MDTILSTVDKSEHEALPTIELGKAYFVIPEMTTQERWLNFAANHPGKLVLMLALCDSAEPLSRSALANHVRSISGVDIPYHDSSIESWGGTLTNTTGVRHTSTTVVFGHRPKEAKAIEATNDGYSEGLPLAGLLLDWQLRNPELPLQKLLGSSSSREGRAYAPTLRMLLFADLVDDTGSSGRSIGRLAQYYEAGYSAKQQTIDILAQEGILTVISQQKINQRKFRVIDPEYHRSQRGTRFENLKPETQAIYRALQIGMDNSVNVWEVDEFLQYASELSPYLNDDEKRRMRIKIQQSLAPSKKDLKGVVEPLETRSRDDGDTEVKVSDEFIESITELVKIFDGFAGGNPEYTTKGNKLARAIYNNRDVIGWLLNYAHEVSSYTDFDLQRIQKVLNILDESSGLCTKEILQRYRERTARNLGTGAMLKTLRDARADGQITSEPEKKLDFKDIKHIVHARV